MAETAVLFVLNQVHQLLHEEWNFLASGRQAFTEIKDELDSIHAFLWDADVRAANGEANEGLKIWVAQLQEASIRIEDVIDEYIHVAQKVYHPGVMASIQKIGHFLVTLKSHYRILSEIEDIKLTIRGIKERSERYNFRSPFEQLGSSSSRRIEAVKWYDPRLASHFIEEAEVVGFESPRNELVDWLVDGAL